MSKIKVFKSAEVVLGDKKQIDFSQIKINNVIKLHNDKNDDIENDSSFDSEFDEASRQIEAIMNEANEEAQKIIEEAKKEAACIIEDAHRESNQIRENARMEGYADGQIQGEEKGYKEVEAFIEEAKEIKTNMMEEKKKVIKEAEKELISLTMECVKKIINHELEEDNSKLMEVIREGLEKCTFTESIVIRVSESDYDLVNTEKNKIFMMTEGIERMDIKCDASLPSGSVIIETLSGTVDSSVDTQIKAIEKLFSDIIISE
ncbi:FliH/SctL family protein [Alkaliphilus peptidifermentans]|uniref:Flagellar assembly protein FliH n=1 Tax=Alkaliphilus peptidifermentans DSM 18978 TaxID=1120976 RepID=A0A1G5DHH5_9FIRM|nr:FliH/SctL family protein [Alkaliphilus peptidifermentans]SCY14349.1 flagellar assembly protein FliH [Alkaliphilus peptidifermentans DSM 18978]